jgi:hypothetical protein
MRYSLQLENMGKKLLELEALRKPKYCEMADGET